MNGYRDVMLKTDQKSFAAFASIAASVGGLKTNGVLPVNLNMWPHLLGLD